MSSLPGSPWGPEAAFSITAATTHAASMMPPDCKSPLWRNVTMEGREGERERGGQVVSEEEEEE